MGQRGGGGEDAKWASRESVAEALQTMVFSLMRRRGVARFLHLKVRHQQRLSWVGERMCWVEQAAADEGYAWMEDGQR